MDATSNDLLKDLLDYARVNHFNVPDDTAKNWEELLESGNSQQDIKNYIDVNVAAVKEKNNIETFISAVRSLQGDELILSKLNDDSKNVISYILKEYEAGNSQWRESLKEKIDNLLEDIQIKTVTDLTPESQGKVGWFVDIASNKGKELSCKMEIEDIYEYALEKGIKLPRKTLSSMSEALQSKEATLDDLTTFIDDVTAHHGCKGLEWWRCQSVSSTGHTMRLYDNYGTLQSFVIERKNKETGKPFYVANKYIDDRNYVQIGINSNLDALMDGVSTYYVGISINEIREINKSKDQKNVIEK